MLKFSDNLPMLFPEAALEAELATAWWVAHTKSRFEKAFAWDLHRKAIPYFLPMVERVTVSGGKKRRGLAPLFAGYVFFQGQREQRYEALLTDRLCQVIEVPEQARLMGELRSIWTVLEQKATLDLYLFAAIGRRCRIRSGPFEGIEGVVTVREERKARFVLQVSILGQGASLEIDADLLESADDSESREKLVAFS